MLKPPSFKKVLGPDSTFPHTRTREFFSPDRGMNIVPPFRQITKASGNIGQAELLKRFVHRDESIFSDLGESGHVDIDRSLVPRVVNPQQYDVVMFRRAVRATIESARLASGRAVDGKRMEKYKLKKRHESAKIRSRGTLGTFLPTKEKTSEPILAISGKPDLDSYMINR